MCHTLFISRNHCNKLLQSVWLKTAAMYSLRVLEAEVPSPGVGRAAVPPAPQGKALPASSRFRWPRCLNRAREDSFPREGRFGGPGGRVEDSPGADTHARGARPRGAERAGRPHAELSYPQRPPARRRCRSTPLLQVEKLRRVCRLAEVSKPRGGRPRAGHETGGPLESQEELPGWWPCPTLSRVPL